MVKEKDILIRVDAQLKQQMFNRITNDEFTTNAQLLQNRC